MRTLVKKAVASVLAVSLTAFGAPICASAADTPSAVGTTTSGGLVFQLMSDGTAQVGDGTVGSGLADAGTTTASVPASVSWQGTAYAVTAVGDNAFNSTNISSVSLPEGLLSIGKRAFRYCLGLTEVDIPDSVTTSGAGAFYADPALERVGFGEASALTSLGDAAFGIKNTNYGEKSDLPTGTEGSLKSITFPAGLTKINDYMCNGQTNLEEIVFKSEELTSIGMYAFCDCEKVETVTLPVLTNTTVPLAQSCFASCDALKTVIFKGDMGNKSQNMTTNYFSGNSIEKYVFYGTKFSMRVFDSSLTYVENFYNIMFFDNKTDALARQNSTGNIVVRGQTTNSDTGAVTVPGATVDQVRNGNISSEYVYEQNNYKAGAWNIMQWDSDQAAFVKVEGSDVISNLCVAYPADAYDLSGAQLTFASGSSTFAYTGSAVDVGAVVTDACGKVLPEGAYTLAFTDAAGSAVDAPVGPGTYTCTATGASPWRGSCSAQLEVVRASASWARLSGPTRYDTMSAIVSASYESHSYLVADQGDPDNPTCEWVVVASGANFPDALAASALAGALGAPVLLTDPSSLSAQASYEIYRIGASRAVIVGGTGAVSAAVADQLRAVRGVTDVYRISGSDRYETAAKIFTLGSSSQIGASWAKTCVVATGTSYADALSASPYAYALGAPVFLCDPSSGLSEATLGAVRSGGFERAVVVGGTSAVPGSAVSQLRSAGVGAVSRVSGSDRYATSCAFAEMAISEGALSADGMAMATGANFPDALAGAALCGRAGSVLLLSGGSGDSSETAFASRHRAEISSGWFLGGTACITEAQADAVRAIWEQ